MRYVEVNARNEKAALEDQGGFCASEPTLWQMDIKSFDTVKSVYAVYCLQSTRKSVASVIKTLDFLNWIRNE